MVGKIMISEKERILQTQMLIESHVKLISSISHRHDFECQDATRLVQRFRNGATGPFNGNLPPLSPLAGTRLPDFTLGDANDMRQIFVTVLQTKMNRLS